MEMGQCRERERERGRECVIGRETERKREMNGCSRNKNNTSR